MDNNTITASEKLGVMRELLTCGDMIYTWIYDKDGMLLESNCNIHVLHTIFEHTGCKASMIKHFSHSKLPVILSAHLGMMWCAAWEKDYEDGQPRSFIVAGPVLSSQVSRETLRDAIEAYHVPVGWRSGFIKQFLSLPTVNPTLFIQYAVMLHYCSTGEKLTRSDVDFQQNDDGYYESQKKSKGSTDRFLTYYTEQQLLNNIREGNLDYRLILENASRLSTGVRAETLDGVGTALISCTSFVSLCVRAAIDGGLSPDAAYTLGDSYIQKMIACKKVTDLRNINHAMYDDFIQAVRHLRQNPSYSKAIQSCIDYIDINLTEDLSLQRLANRTGYAGYYLTRKFHEETGQTLKDYIRSARIKHAALLLETTDMPVSHIAQQLRFCSSSYFSANFQNETGLTPKEYRNKNKKM